MSGSRSSDPSGGTTTTPGARRLYKRYWDDLIPRKADSTGIASLLSDEARWSALDAAPSNESRLLLDYLLLLGRNKFILGSLAGLGRQMLAGDERLDPLHHRQTSNHWR